MRLTTVDLHRLDKFFSSCINKTLSARKDIQLSKIHGSEESDRCLHFSVKKKRVTKTLLGGHRFVSCLERTKRSNHGGAGRDRTDDLRLAKPALSQLSYSPTKRTCAAISRSCRTRSKRIDRPRVFRHPGPVSIPERASRHSRSGESSPDRPRVANELPSGGPPGRWWAWVDSNHRPPAYQADALTG